MRSLPLLIMTAFIALAPASGYTQDGMVEPSVQAWDQCVGESTQDYVDMFGIVSMRDGEDIDKAVEDCWDFEYKFSQDLKASMPQLTESGLNRLVQNRKRQIRDKWFAFYAKDQRPNLAYR